jgi:hypothetical protein
MDFGNDAGTDNIVITQFQSDGTIVAQLNVKPQLAYFYTSFNFNTQNKWNHIAWTLDPTGSGTSIVYINGVQVSSVSPALYPRSILRSSNFIGRSNWNNFPGYFNGGIKDFRMYNRALSANEVSRLFTSTQTIFISGSRCANCPAGFFSQPQSISCTACTAGSFSPLTGSASCDSCLPGYSSAAGSASCKQCLSGSYAYSQLIVNEDFELNTVTPNGFQYQLPSSWQSTQGNTIVVSTKSPVWGNGIAAPSGNNYLAVQGGNLKQTVVVPFALVGATLTVQFYLAKRSDYSYNYGSTRVQVSINSVVLQTISVEQSFTYYSISAPVTNAIIEVIFQDSSPIVNEYSTFLIDNIKLSLSGTD